jgi:hypothetical protein
MRRDLSAAAVCDLLTTQGLEHESARLTKNRDRVAFKLASFHDVGCLFIHKMATMRHKIVPLYNIS